MAAILARAARLLPFLSHVSPGDVLGAGLTRTGLRPYLADGRPLIGPVPGAPGLFLATGHEGSGLCMAMATAELVRDLVEGRPPKVSAAAFAPGGRLLAAPPRPI